MATKTITITEDSYQRLNALKDKHESFSDVIKRVTGKVKLTDFVGILTKDEARTVRERINKMREYSSRHIKTVRER